MPLTSTDQHNWFPNVYLTVEQTLLLEKLIRQQIKATPLPLLSLLRDINEWRDTHPHDNGRYAALELDRG